MDTQYHIAFDLAVSGYKAWTSLTPGLILVAAGLFIAIFPDVMTTHWWSRRAIQIWGWVIATFAAILSAVGFWATYSEYLGLTSRLASERYDVAEGTVENYRQDRNSESFTVNNVPFEYSDSRSSSAFNNTAAQGGPVRPGLAVRIAYAEGKVLRLEIRR